MSDMIYLLTKVTEDLFSFRATQRFDQRFQFIPVICRPNIDDVAQNSSNCTELAMELL